jgi:hypothetical protein
MSLEEGKKMFQRERGEYCIQNITTPLQTRVDASTGAMCTCGGFEVKPLLAADVQSRLRLNPTHGGLIHLLV